jgi:chromosome segregation ATPase
MAWKGLGGKVLGALYNTGTSPDPATDDSSAGYGASPSFSPSPDAAVPDDIQAAATPDEDLVKSLEAELRSESGAVWRLLDAYAELAGVISDPAQHLNAALKVSKVTPADVAASLNANLQALERESGQVGAQHEAKVRQVMDIIDANQKQLEKRIEELTTELGAEQQRLTTLQTQRDEAGSRLAKDQARNIAAFAAIRERLEQARGVE